MKFLARRRVPETVSLKSWSVDVKSDGSANISFIVTDRKEVRDWLIWFDTLDADHGKTGKPYRTSKVDKN